MSYESILDSPSQLSNLKNRLGLRVSERNTTAVYLAQTKLRKFLEEKLQFKIPNKWHRGELIAKITDKCKDIDTANGVYELFYDMEVDQFIDLASGKIRPFNRTLDYYVAA